MSKVWIEQITAHLELLEGIVSHLPAGETLRPDDLNNVLQLMEKTRNIFLMQCEFQGFTVQKGEQK